MASTYQWWGEGFYFTLPEEDKGVLMGMTRIEFSKLVSAEPFADLTWQLKLACEIHASEEGPLWTFVIRNDNGSVHRHGMMPWMGSVSDLRELGVQRLDLLLAGKWLSNTMAEEAIRTRLQDGFTEIYDLATRFVGTMPTKTEEN